MLARLWYIGSRVASDLLIALEPWRLVAPLSLGQDLLFIPFLSPFELLE